jgi:hypothetical protein
MEDRSFKDEMRLHHRNLHILLFMLVVATILATLTVVLIFQVEDKIARKKAGVSKLSSSDTVRASATIRGAQKRAVTHIL